jgi:hypothetical protein
MNIITKCPLASAFIYLMGIVSISLFSQMSIAGQQIVSSSYVAQNNVVQIQVSYTANSGLSGLGLRLHFNSKQLLFTQLDQTLFDGLVSEQRPVEDTEDYDRDPLTDSYILVAWADIFNGNWPNTRFSDVLLYNASFTWDTNKTTVNYTASSTAVKHELVAESILIQ